MVAFLYALSGAACAQPAPELASGWQAKRIARSQGDMVVAANPLAVAAGVNMLRGGGNAIDAAVAVQMVLNLVEPQSSGVGGGAFILYYDVKTRRLTSYDGRETAPAAAGSDLFLQADGRPLPFPAAVVGGRSVGTPGVLRALELAHHAHGRLPWWQLFMPAVKLARDGFVISPRLAVAIAGDAALCTQEPAREYFCDAQGKAKPAGTWLRNPELAQTFIDLAYGGADAFYGGDIARDVVAKVRSHADNPGGMTLEDLAAYRAKEREPVCAEYRMRWKICGMGPPSSGALTVLQTLGMLGHFALPRPDVRAIHLISEAYRLAYADRGKYIADGDFVQVPVAGLLDRDYLAARARRIDPEHAMESVEPGVLPGVALVRGKDATLDVPGTSHISIVDAQGNVVSMTTTIESAFGSKQMVRGFLLNNQLTDFSFAPTDDSGRPIANSVAPGKRPRSSMAPTIAFDRQGRVRLVLGSPGGGEIIQYVAKTLIGVLDWQLDIQHAIDFGNFGGRDTPTIKLEAGTSLEALAPALTALGHSVALRDENSGVHGIAIRYLSGGGRVLEGGADPRREGMAGGNARGDLPQQKKRTGP